MVDGTYTDLLSVAATAAIAAKAKTMNNFRMILP